jgi:protein-arginine kinase activator protein McsA
MTKEIDQIEIETRCPICNRNVSEIWIAKMDSIIGTRYAYICGECKSLIKLSKEKIPYSSIKTFLSIPTLTNLEVL